MIKTMKWLIAGVACLLIVAGAVKAQNTPDIIEFRNGQITWTNVDPALYYTVEWVPTLTDTNWTGSFRGLQDLQSSAPTMTADVPMLLRIVGNSNAAYTATLSPATAVVSAGYYAVTNLTQVDTNLVTANIKAGMTIFGVAGDGNVVDTSSGDVAAGDVRAGKKAWAAGSEVTGSIESLTLSPTTAVVNAGFYAATNLAEVDTDLAAGNIATNSTIFGIAGTLSTNAGSAYPAVVVKSGQTNSYRKEDDGWYSTNVGVAWPIPRFTVQSDTNVVLDNLTGLMWARNAYLPGGTRTWNQAIDYCTNLVYGGYSDWRLPNRRELLSLINDGAATSPKLPAGHFFSNVYGDWYWTSTTWENTTSYAYYVHVGGGQSHIEPKSSSYYVWPVRGGQ